MIHKDKISNATNFFYDLILGELQNNSIKCWIAGGAVRDFFMDRKAQSDYDIFFPNETELEKAKKYFINNGAEVKWESENGIKLIYNKNIFDLVKIYYSTPEKTIQSFDFTVSMFAVDNKKVYCGEYSFEDLDERVLMINKITYPESSLKRAFRYYKRGFTMPVNEISKLYNEIKELPEQIGNNDFLNFSSSYENTEQTKKPNDYSIPALLGLGVLFFIVLKS